jgi:3-hydroxyisobutyrate dehydrogenase-like beta-hydroxyacid dehydrogenase
MTESVGFLGAGQMGEPMVARLLAEGHRPLVFARRDDVRSRLSAQGVALVDSVAALARRSDILISCLFSDEQLRAAGTGEGGFIANAKPGLIFVSHTTGSASTLMELLASHSSAPTIVDAPVSGTPDHIARGELTVLVGGPAEAVSRVTPVLKAFAGNIIATGELGSALNIKLINNVLFAANVQLITAATELGERLRVVANALLEALAVSSGDSTAGSYVRGVGGLQPFRELAAPFLRKDVAAAVETAKEVGADLGLLGHVVHNGPLTLTAAAP